MSTLDGVIGEVRDALYGTPGRLMTAVVAGLGIGIGFRPADVVLPIVGAVPNIVIGAVVFAIGGGAFLHLKRASSGCDCVGECTCR